ncbi:MAG: hypothetical protein A2700_00065 [Candidatus Blackburnbacteria bacterium RIFCSPHIGHO2_01_FULL_44_64]|uniref:Uncharacterized protein n=1 Tax=Candidatus Blackburnbacteria bacterium RIFCSPHIGHO2_02_FULL_44_20 TaxID=1797516 RepID=A0A1G1V8H2_9BACT|nr:MAG: hypothetical protein A2700_00065 [Candidatus Blackburnbacteria bacterium RIFCSPHIGHO2_01_FULL_44_64]OGY11578.1 MAG: hypothetical protein A3E16_04490 [Candidatus Blackburnbacteria bacterium RIFCSPHIGHO2_12_FULL_44_25]OGY11676.1 MAG: hypothetical protein A3D26_01005 [Candidatus Blackburnbacteria bacterium RIFCSPHIGHO2_02_FULL_44_20]OGY13970.1 MAG: hypothetical protein A3A62_01265 [Candidatus Blackburnbacteria bacterium RIFCSPLOWO2_01_FULL_44_43]OGY17402.1 MAG: hypothetical protein A3H88_0
MTTAHRGFVPIIILVIIALVSGIGLVAYKGRGTPTPPNSSESTPSATPAEKPSVFDSLKKALEKTIVTPTPTPTQSSSNNPSPTATPVPTNSISLSPTATPTPLNSQNNSCNQSQTICFNKSDVNVTVQEGTGLQNGGWTTDAFTISGKGSKGFLLNTSGLPAGVTINPGSGAFTDGSTLNIKAWVNTNNVNPYGDYSGTVTLKIANGDGSYSTSPHTLPIKITYAKNPNPTVDPNLPNWKIKSPNGGETLKIGDKVMIEWEVNDTFGNYLFYISTSGPNTSTTYITSVSNSQARSYEWTVNVGNVADNYSQPHKIKIIRYLTGGGYSGTSTPTDESDNYFTIIK